MVMTRTGNWKKQEVESAGKIKIIITDLTRDIDLKPLFLRITHQLLPQVRCLINL